MDQFTFSYLRICSIGCTVVSSKLLYPVLSDVPFDANSTGKLLCAERHIPIELCLKLRVNCGIGRPEMSGHSTSLFITFQFFGHFKLELGLYFIVLMLQCVPMQSRISCLSLSIDEIDAFFKFK